LRLPSSFGSSIEQATDAATATTSPRSRELIRHLVALSSSRDIEHGLTVPAKLSNTSSDNPPREEDSVFPDITSSRSPSSEASPSLSSLRPPPFSSLYFPLALDQSVYITSVTTAEDSGTSAITAPATPSFELFQSTSTTVADTKAALPRDTKGESSSKSVDEGEPPPPYTEGISPLDCFTYVMAAAGGPASIITQVQQTGGPPLNTLGGRSTCI
jgi:hypothetical protein